MSDFGFGGDTIEKEKVTEAPSEPGDHDKFAHYVNAKDLTEAMVYGIALPALCGKVWVPTRDGLKFPVCPECQKIYETLEDG